MSALPKGWFGNKVQVGLATGAETDPITLLDADTTGILVEGLKTVRVFIPWHAIITITEVGADGA